MKTILTPLDLGDISNLKNTSYRRSHCVQTDCWMKNGIELNIFSEEIICIPLAPSGTFLNDFSYTIQDEMVHLLTSEKTRMLIKKTVKL